MDDNLNKIKQFESILKLCIKDFFGTLLSSNIVTILDNNSYYESINLKTLNTREEVQGTILRSMLNDVVNITYKKDINNLNYGEYIEELIIEYYSKLISEKYKFNINDGIVDKNGFINILKEKLNANFDKLMLTSDLSLILQNDGLDEIIQYLNKNENITISEDTNTSLQDNIIQEYTDSKGSIQFVDDNGKVYLKYIDENKQSSMTELLPNSKVMEYFKDRVDNLESDATLSSDIFLLELNDIIYEEKLHMNDSSALNRFEDSLTTDTGEYNVNNPINSSSIPNNIESVEKVDFGNVNNPKTQLTPQKYEELCIKYANGEELTQEEIQLLAESSPELAESIIHSNLNPEPTLSFSQTSSSGKVFNPYLFFLIGIGCSFIIILILALCNLD